MMHFFNEIAPSLNGPITLAIFGTLLASILVWSVAPYAAAPSFAVLGAGVFVRGVYQRLTSKDIPKAVRAANQRLDALDRRLSQRNKE